MLIIKENKYSRFKAVKQEFEKKRLIRFEMLY